jgi:hypothetical protein
MEKRIKQLAYEVQHYKEKDFYFFVITCPETFEAIMANPEFVIGMYAERDAIYMESDDIIFGLRELPADIIKAFRRKKPFYFRFVNYNKEVLNVLALNPITNVQENLHE